MSTFEAQVAKSADGGTVVYEATFEVSMTMSFDNAADMTDADLEGAVAAANGVSASQVTVTKTSRRMTGSARRLAAATYDVVIKTTSAADASAVKTKADDADLLAEAFTNAGISAEAPTITPPVGTVTVKTVITVPEGKSADDIKDHADGNLDKNLKAAKPEWEPTSTSVASVPAPAPSPPVGPPGSSNDAASLSKLFALIFAMAGASLSVTLSGNA